MVRQTSIQGKEDGVRLTRFSVIAVLTAFLCLDCVQSLGDRATMIVPPILQSPPHGLDATKKPGSVIYLQAWPTLPGWGVQLSVINDSEKEFEFDQRRLCEFSGLEAFAVDTEGNQHKLEVSQLLPPPPYALGASDKFILTGFERIALQPHESYSWPIAILHPEDRPSRELQRLPYKIAHFECVLALENGARFRSNIFDLGVRPPQTRRVQGPAPKQEFSQRLDSFRWWHRTDPGARLATLLSFCTMKKEGLVSEDQFSQLLAAAGEDASPLIRAHATVFHKTWQTLLLDADPRVRSQALKAAGGPQATQQMSLMPILLGKVQDGDADTRVLALKALAIHTGGSIGRQFRETIDRARNDREPMVVEAARKLFPWVKQAGPDETRAQPGDRESD
jgi:hypothetical protein